MLTRLARAPASRVAASRAFSSASGDLPKVGIVGAAGGIGQPLALLLKVSELVGDIACIDVVNAKGVAADLSHIATTGEVSGYDLESAKEGLKGCNLVLVPAGVPRKPGMSRDDLFNTNAGIVRDVAELCAEACPDAFFGIISNPVNSTVPIFAEVLKSKGVYDKRRLFGVTTLDVCRANTFVAENQNKPVEEMDVTVIGGHAGTTILPVLSQESGMNFSEADLDELTQKISFGGDIVVQAKDGTGSATLSMAYAAAVFSESLLAAAGGEPDVVECAYVESDAAAKDGAEYFATPITLGPNGVEEIHPIPALSEREQKQYEAMIGDLKAQIQKGKDFMNQ
mmetsp:Transcript_29132/g.59690  ORF Transcript_29132/g.59690 Transcript_29132/m.59690 type:complete len:340 (-) Transcript_29132:9-1028(-)|eukprot:CAMPEP_0181333456 /NCGR_PEP_ID=MMETSP1101-20121128/25686_1 /TAXON_ID=46948 /ORGANISM="Rhodomonas abbreviata, Strain Caron Lab Isolate" /LENGTH=339 /DNA_ID=CAMNT_0023443267 /DNA_START=17 /DNA_END=1036 /DNA_ORIENTATION=-